MCDTNIAAKENHVFQDVGQQSKDEEQQNYHRQTHH